MGVLAACAICKTVRYIDDKPMPNNVQRSDHCPHCNKITVMNEIRGISIYNLLDSQTWKRLGGIEFDLED